MLFNFVNDITTYLNESNINLKIPFSIEYKINENLNNSQNLSELKKIISETNNKISYPFIIKPINGVQWDTHLLQTP